jgi:hypothetical protein
MDGYYKLIRKDKDLAIVEVAGWEHYGVVLSREHIDQLKVDVEALHDHVHGEGHRLIHFLWEHISSLQGQARSKQEDTPTDDATREV